MNIAAYELFDLRDADSSRPNLFCQFGLLREDYEPKAAFETYRRLGLRFRRLAGDQFFRDLQRHAFVSRKSRLMASLISPKPHPGPWPITLPPEVPFEVKPVRLALVEAAPI